MAIFLLLEHTYRLNVLLIVTIVTAKMPAKPYFMLYVGGFESHPLRSETRINTGFLEGKNTNSNKIVTDSNRPGAWSSSVRL